MYTIPSEDLKDIADRLLSIWPKNRSFLLTGGTGFFGRWLVEAVAYLEKKTQAGNQFQILTRQENAQIFKSIPCLANENIFKIQQQDLENPFQVTGKIDYVIHAATDVGQIKNAAATNLNYLGLATSTNNLLEACRNQRIERFLFVSSGGVYDSVEQKGAREESLEVSQKFCQLDDLSNYSNAKRKCESLIFKFFEKSQTKICVARCFSFVGPFANPQMVAMDMLSEKVLGRPIVVKSPHVVRSFLYPSDLVVALLTLAICPTRFNVYNVGSAEKNDLSTLAKMVDGLQAPMGTQQIVDEHQKALAGNEYYPNISRLLSEYPDVFKIDLQLALKKTLAFKIEGPRNE